MKLLQTIDFKNPKTNFIIITGFVIVNIILKMVFLGFNSYWLDEASQVYISSQSISDIYRISIEHSNGPVYSMLLKYWMALFGYSEFSTRFLSVLFSAFTIPVFYNLIKKHWNAHIAIAASLMFTLSTWQAYYAHETRSYTFITLLVVVSYSLFFDLLKKTTTKKIIGYTLINIILLYTHLTPIIALFTQGILTIFYLRKDFRKIMWIWISLFVSLGALAIWFYSNQWFGGNETVWMAKPGYKELIGMFYAFFNTKIVFSIFLISTFIYSLKSLLNRKLEKYNLGTFMWGVFPILIIYVASIYYNPRFTHRYMLYAIPGLYLTFSIIIYSVLKHKSVLYWVVMGVIIILMGAKLDLKLKYNGNWRDAIKEVKNSMNDNDIIVSVPIYTTLPFVLYYDLDQFKSSSGYYPTLSESNVFFSNGADVFNRIDFYNHRHLYLVTSSHTNVTDPDGNTLRYAKKHFKLIKTSGDKYRSVKLYVFDLDDVLAIKTVDVDFTLFAKKDKDKETSEWYVQVNPTREFYTVFEKSCSFLLEPVTQAIEVEAEVKCLNDLSEVGFVISVESAGQSASKLYKYFPINEYGDKEQWNMLKETIYFGDNIDENDIIKLYLWRKDKESTGAIKHIQIKLVQ